MAGPSLDLWHAGAANHRSYFAATATAGGGSVQHRYGGVVTRQPGAGLMVAFPSVPVAELSAFADEVDCLARQHPRPAEVGWWTLDEAEVPAAGARVLARGFHWGWRPNWMALDVTHLVTDHPVPAGLEIRPTGNGFEAWLARGRVGGIAFHRSEFDGRPIGGIYDTVVEPGRADEGTAPP